MGISKHKLFYTSLLLIILFSSFGYAQEDKKMYYRGIRAMRAGNKNFAFFDFRRLLEKFPTSRFVEPALFTIGEYYFSIAAYYDAGQAFTKHINDYPESKAKLFSLVYLLKLAEIEGNESLVKDLKKEIIVFFQLSFLFRDFKEYQYRSPSYRRYKAVYYIDRVEFYIDGKQFAQILY